MELKLTKKDKQNLKEISKILAGILLILLSAFMIIEILIPFIISTIQLFISLIRLLPSLDPNFKFIAGAFFLMIYYHVASAVLFWVIIILNLGVEVISNYKR